MHSENFSTRRSLWALVEAVIGNLHGDSSFDLKNSIFHFHFPLLLNSWFAWTFSAPSSLEVGMCHELHAIFTFEPHDRERAVTCPFEGQSEPQWLSELRIPNSIHCKLQRVHSNRTELIQCTCKRLPNANFQQQRDSPRTYLPSSDQWHRSRV